MESVSRFEPQAPGGEAAEPKSPRDLREWLALDEEPEKG